MQPRHANGRPPAAPNGYPTQPAPHYSSNGNPHQPISEQHAASGAHSSNDTAPRRVASQDTEPLTPASGRQLAQPSPRHGQEQSRHAAGYPRQQPQSSNAQHQQQYKRAPSPVKGQHTLTVNGTAATPSSAPPAVSPSSASSSNSALSRLSGSRQLLLFLGVAALVLSLPLLYILLSSSFVTSALCSSAFLASTTLSTNHVPLTTPLSMLQTPYSSSTSPTNYPHHPALFTLPSPTPATYLTAHIDPSTSLHAQLTQFLYAPLLALQLNVSYAYNPLSKAQGQWGRWLGLGWGERAEDGLLGQWGRVRVFQYDGAGLAGAGGEDGGGGAGVDGVAGMQAVQAWIADKRRKVDDINKRLIDYSRNKHKLGNLEPPHIEEPKGSHVDGPDTTALNPNSPINTASVLRLSRLPLPALQLACYAPLHLLVRQKYCAARVREPVPIDLYAEDRARGRMIVAVHYRCGDECYHPTKSIPLSSTLTTLQRLTALTTQHALPPPAFHLFTSPPPNDTAANYFHPLTTAFPTARLHLSHHSHLLLHHLVASDVLVLPGLDASGLSWLAELLHGGGVVLVGGGLVHGCGGEVGGYRERDGEFHGESFVKMWRWSVELQGAWRRFGSLQDCYAIKPLVPPGGTTITGIGSKQTTNAPPTAAAAGKG